MRLQIETPTWGLDAINKDAERNLNRHPWPLVTFLCKSLVFGFVDVDLFRYFDSIYNLQIKFIYKYLRPMVIHCKDLIKFHWFSGEIFMICLRFCITLATIVHRWHSNCSLIQLARPEACSFQRMWMHMIFTCLSRVFIPTCCKTTHSSSFSLCCHWYSVFWQ